MVKKSPKGLLLRSFLKSGRYIRRPDDDDVIYVTAATNKLAMEGEYLAPWKLLFAVNKNTIKGEEVVTKKIFNDR